MTKVNRQLNELSSKCREMFVLAFPSVNVAKSETATLFNKVESSLRHSERIQCE